MQCVLTQAGTILAELELLAARLTPDRVVVVTSFLTNQEHGFRFLFAFRHYISILLNDARDGTVANRVSGIFAAFCACVVPTL